jgi:hypothetical protein
MCIRFVDRATAGVLATLFVLSLLGLSNSVCAATPGEILEKAIYTEETVGNLGEAIKLYEKVIAEGKSARSAAAQAQYRLGLVYKKMNKQAEATAAFESLIKDFPDEKDLIAKAQKHLPSALELLPVPWTDGEVLQLNMKLATGLDIGTMICMVEADKHEGKDVWRCSNRGIVTINGGNGYSEVLCEKESFAPIRSHWKHSLLGEASATYTSNTVEIMTVGNKEPRKIEFNPPMFDNEQCIALFRRLPLEVGYKTNLPIVSILGTGQMEIALDVPSKEMLEVPAGKFECYKLVLSPIGQTFWISTDKNRYPVRFSAGGVTTDLAKIEHRKPGETKKVTSEHFSFTLPDRWHAYMPEDPSKKGESEAALLDPTASAIAEVSARAKDTLKVEHQKSPLAWTESYVDVFKKRLADFKVRDKGLQEQQIGDRTVATLVADFTDDGKKKTLYGVAAFGEKSAATVRLTADADKFDVLRKDFDTIVKSLELK